MNYIDNMKKVDSMTKRNSVSDAKIAAQLESLPSISKNKHTNKSKQLRNVNYNNINLSYYTDNCNRKSTFDMEGTCTQFHNEKLKKLLLKSIYASNEHPTNERNSNINNINYSRNTDSVATINAISKSINNNCKINTRATNLSISNQSNTKLPISRRTRHSVFNSFSEGLFLYKYNKPSYKISQKKSRAYAVNAIMKDMNPARRFHSYLNKIRKSMSHNIV
jgi:hypothetical protein